MKEFTFRSVILGLINGLLFGIGNAYVCLQIGSTIPSSVVGAVIAVTTARFFSRKSTLLENNIIQTTGSMGEALAAGIVFVLPAAFMLKFKIPLSTILPLTILSGLLGVLLNIPLRHNYIVKKKGELPYPEGKATAHILKSAKQSQPRIGLILFGLIVGIFYRLCTSVFSLWKELPGWIIKFYGNTHIMAHCSPALLAAGYIIKHKLANILFTGCMLSWLVINPLIKFFCGNIIISPGTIPISQMTTDDIWFYYIRYIGIGAIAGATIEILFNLVIPYFKLIFLADRASKERKNYLPSDSAIKRTDQDIPRKWRFVMLLGVLLGLLLYKPFGFSIISIAILLVIGYLAVVLSSYGAGIVGSSSDPVSGITILAFLFIIFTFHMLNWTELGYFILILLMMLIINIVTTIGAIESQSFKAGHLVGATPFYQEISQLIGTILPSIGIIAFIYLFEKGYGLGSAAMPAPQASMIALLIEGFMEGGIPLMLIGIGIVISLTVRILGIPVAPFAIGLYIPFFIGLPFLIGGLTSWLVEKLSKNNKETEKNIFKGDIICSGLVAGDAIIGIVVILLFSGRQYIFSEKTYLSDNVSFLTFLILAGVVAWLSLKTPQIFQFQKKTRKTRLTFPKLS